MKKILSLLLITIVLAGCTPKGYGELSKFLRPDIKDDFCGVHINFQYCKCAFHNEYCDAIGLDKGAAKSYVYSEYDKWINDLLATFETSCTTAGGFYTDEACQYCTDGYVSNGEDCVDQTVLAEKGSEEIANNTGEELFDADCNLNQELFDQDWRKYSDIDDVIPFEERSYEAKQAVTAYENMIEKMVLAFELERDIEIENQMQTELTEYRTALVNNIKTNLLKAFWRLSWVTYNTIQSGKGLGQSYTQVLNASEAAEAVGAGLKVVQGVIPGNSSLAIDTSDFSGKVESVGVNVALEAVDTLGDPVKVATELFKSAASAPLPSADISEEEINILREQHLNKGVIDKALADSQAANNERQTKLNQLETEIVELQTQIDEWEAKEKDRVKAGLENTCENGNL